MPPPDASDAASRAVSACATPVTVVTSDGPGGRVGQTVSAFAVVSADPAVIMVAIGERSPANEIITANGHFRVNVLGISHDHVADTFAGRPWAGKERYDFTCGTWETDAPHGPRLTDATASFACRIQHRTELATHLAWFGAVVEAQTQADMPPLLYLKRIYRQLAELPLSTFPEFPDAKPPYERVR